MGDYTKIIVHAEVKKINKQELLDKIEELDLYESAYHCDGVVKLVEERSDNYPGDRYVVTLIGQTKWGERQEHFLDWLEPHILQGMGPLSSWSIQFNEYSDLPTIRSVREGVEE